MVLTVWTSAAGTCLTVLCRGGWRLATDSVALRSRRGGEGDISYACWWTTARYSVPGCYVPVKMCHGVKTYRVYVHSNPPHDVMQVKILALLYVHTSASALTPQGTRAAADGTSAPASPTCARSELTHRSVTIRTHTAGEVCQRASRLPARSTSTTSHRGRDRHRQDVVCAHPPAVTHSAGGGTCSERPQPTVGGCVLRIRSTFVQVTDADRRDRCRPARRDPQRAQQWHLSAANAGWQRNDAQRHRPVAGEPDHSG